MKQQDTNKSRPLVQTMCLHIFHAVCRCHSGIDTMHTAAATRPKQIAKAVAHPSYVYHIVLCSQFTSSIKFCCVCCACVSCDVSFVLCCVLRVVSVVCVSCMSCVVSVCVFLYICVIISSFSQCILSNHESGVCEKKRPIYKGVSYVLRTPPPKVQS